MTGVELLAEVRILIAEGTENLFKSTNIQVLLNSALKKWAGIIQNKFTEWYMKTGTVTIVADSRSIALPTDCTGTIKRVHLSDDTPLDPKPFGMMYEGLTGVPAAYCLVGNNIWTDTTVDSDTVITLYYYYIPDAIVVTGTTEIDFPKMNHTLLAYEAALKCAVKNADYVRVQALTALRDEEATALYANLTSRVKDRSMGSRMAFENRRTSMEGT